MSTILWTKNDSVESTSCLFFELELEKKYFNDPIREWKSIREGKLRIGQYVKYN